MAQRGTHQKITDEIDQVSGGSLTSPEDAVADFIGSFL